MKLLLFQHLATLPYKVERYFKFLTDARHGWKLDHKNFICENLFWAEFGKTKKYLSLKNFRLYGIHVAIIKVPCYYKTQSDILKKIPTLLTALWKTISYILYVITIVNCLAMHDLCLATKPLICESFNRSVLHAHVNMHT